MKRLFAVSEVAARFAVTSQTVRNWIADGRLIAIQATPRGRYRITPEALHALERDAIPRGRGSAIEAELQRVVAVVVPDGSQRRRVAMKSYESLATVRGRSVGVDVVVLTPQLISTERDLVGSIARAVTREGVLVFGSAVS